jgi:hypothetical protein
MRFQLLTKNLFCSLLFIGLLSLNGVALAQVYKSYDANGNVVFSDKPTKRSSEVEISKPNLSDSFEIPPPAESPPETKPEAVPKPEPVAQPETDYDPADTNKNGRVSRREKEEQRKERRKKKRAAEKAAEGDEG